MEYYLQFLGAKIHVVWPVMVALVSFVFAVVASCHAIMYKRDTRATIAWVGVIMLAPILGTALYVLLGVNRIRRKAAVLRGQPVRFGSLARPIVAECASDHLLPPACASLAALARMMDGVTR